MLIVKSDLQISQGLPINQHKDQTKSVLAISDILNDVCVLYYGVHTSQISDVVIKKAITEILKKYNSLSIEEIKYSFERLKLERLVTVVLNDLINPIQRYVNVKEQIRKEKYKLQQEIDDEQNRIENAKKFIQESLQIYRDSLERKEWLGTIWHASAIAKEYFSDKFTKEEKNELYNEAKRKYSEIQVLIENDPTKIYENIGKNSTRIFSELIIIQAIKKQIKI